MGRELQKKKNRSSLNKVTRKPKSKKKHFGNAIIAANWDKNLTLQQNYKRLGLTAGLNRPTGGIEKTVKILQDGGKTHPDDRLHINSKCPAETAPREAVIERDQATGEILRIIDPSSQTENPLNDLLNEFEDDEDGENGQPGQTVRKSSRQTEVVRQLEEMAAAGNGRDNRHQSVREVEWIESLVAKHGDDYQKMFWDRKLNPMQESVGQLKRKVERWRKSTKK